MKELLLNALKAKFEGVSDKILGRIADKLTETVTTAEGVDAAVAGVSFLQVLESYGDSRATEAQQTAVKNYEKKHGLKDGKAVEPAPTGGEPKPNNTGDDVPAWAKALIDSNKSLTDRLNKMDGDRTTETRKQQLSAVVSKLPEAIRKPYDRISLESMTDEQFTALVGEVTTEVDGLMADMSAKGAVFGRPAVVHGAPNPTALTKEQEAAIAKREGVPSKDSQPF